MAAFLNQLPTAERVKVKRDGARGWHWISAAHFDPAKHELIEQPGQPAPTAAPAAARKTRTPKHLPTEATNGDR